MKIVAIGGTGLIGRKLTPHLTAKGHDVLAASPSKGVNAVTGEGLDAALKDADIVVDVANAPSWEDAAVLAFFEASSRNLAEAEKKAGVKHHVALSIVNTDRLPDSGYMRAKAAQEKLIKASGVPYTILRATQFMEFVEGIAQSCIGGDVVHLPAAAFQPIASDDVAAALAEVTLKPPVNGHVDVGGPEKKPMADFVRELFAAKGETRRIVADNEGRYFGTKLDDTSLVPLGPAMTGKIRFGEWVG
jgi:uncharacterized protein YbjT (DUF2867 family)